MRSKEELDKIPNSPVTTTTTTTTTTTRTVSTVRPRVSITSRFAASMRSKFETLKRGLAAAKRALSTLFARPARGTVVSPLRKRQQANVIKALDQTDMKIVTMPNMVSDEVARTVFKDTIRCSDLALNVNFLPQCPQGRDTR